MSEYDYRKRCLSQKINCCNNCGTNNDLVVHHINGDRSDNQLENLVPLCNSCHSKLHTSKDPPGILSVYQNKLPESALSFGHEPASGDKGWATETVPIKPETKQLIQERKKDGKTYDLWMREQMGVE